MGEVGNFFMELVAGLMLIGCVLGIIVVNVDLYQYLFSHDAAWTQVRSLAAQTQSTGILTMSSLVVAVLDIFVIVAIVLFVWGKVDDWRYPANKRRDDVYDYMLDRACPREFNTEDK